jgi:hypothetical protein
VREAAPSFSSQDCRAQLLAESVGLRIQESVEVSRVRVRSSAPPRRAVNEPNRLPLTRELRNDKFLHAILALAPLTIDRRRKPILRTQHVVADARIQRLDTSV